MGVLFKQESAADLVSTLPLRSLDFSRVPVGLDYLHLLFVQPISHYPDPGTTAPPHPRSWNYCLHEKWPLEAQDTYGTCPSPGATTADIDLFLVRQRGFNLLTGRVPARCSAFPHLQVPPALLLSPCPCLSLPHIFVRFAELRHAPTHHPNSWARSTTDRTGTNPRI